MIRELRQGCSSCYWLTVCVHVGSAFIALALHPTRMGCRRCSYEHNSQL
jgi:hypothetical protein